MLTVEDCGVVYESSLTALGGKGAGLSYFDRGPASPLGGFGGGAGWSPGLPKGLLCGSCDDASPCDPGFGGSGGIGGGVP